MTHIEDQDVVGIHPEKMQALIGELKAAHRVIAAFAGEFSAPLSALGISVNTVHQSEHWTSDQVRSSPSGCGSSGTTSTRYRPGRRADPAI